MIILLAVIVFLIVYTMIGYPLLLEVLNKCIPHKKVDVNKEYEPTVTIVIPAHNEEKVIEAKVRNVVEMDYPKEKLEVIVASDHSTDSTEQIVTQLQEELTANLVLYSVKERKGKTNGQDEAVRVAKGEVLVMTDANAMLKEDSVKELVSYLHDPKVGYVAGQLVYINEQATNTSDSEATYWSIDMKMRTVESNLSSITAGNGSIYAVRRADYMEIDPIYSHDSVFPLKFALKNQRAVYNPKAIAYEKAGESDQDEFKRKVRMARKGIALTFLDFRKYNVFKYGWFSLFYFSHRTLRNNLYFLHMLLFLVTWISYAMEPNTLLLLFGIAQTVFYLSAILFRKSSHLLLKLPSYYCMTIGAQLIGAFKEITGQSKPFWEKAESTR